MKKVDVITEEEPNRSTKSLQIEIESLSQRLDYLERNVSALRDSVSSFASKIKGVYFKGEITKEDIIDDLIQQAGKMLSTYSVREY